MTDTRQVDVAIVGAGSAGLSARREVELRGRSYALIEPGPHGTTCARVGCMPSKLLIAAADAAHQVQQAPRFGVALEAPPQIDGAAVMARVQSERDRFVGFVTRSVESLPEDKLIPGRARFVSPTELSVDDRVRVQARAIIIATGSSPFVPSTLDGVREHVLVNDDLFDLPTLPGSVAVFGTGIIALELGQALHRLGVDVVFFNPFDEVGPVTDPAVQASVREVLGKELTFHVGIPHEVQPHAEGGIVVRWQADGRDHQRRFDKALAAAGRRPNLAGLGLEALGVPLDRRGLPPFDSRTLQVGDLPVFLAGDVNGDRPLLHEATDEGRIAGTNAALFPEVRAHVRRTALGIAFTDPQIAMVGARHGDLPEHGFVIGEVSYANQGRARVMGKNAGLVRVYVDKAEGRLLGAEMFGPAVEHLAHLLAWAVAQGMSVTDALRMPFYHPVVEEGLRTALRSAAAKLNLAPKPCAFELDCGPGT